MLQVQPRPSLSYHPVLSPAPQSTTMEQLLSFESIKVYNCSKGQPQYATFRSPHPTSSYLGAT